MAYDLLEGVKVVELSMSAFAPDLTAVLADWGADVINVVTPRTADPMRGNSIAGLPNKDVGISFMWEQRETVLLELGMDFDKITALKSAGVIH